METLKGNTAAAPIRTAVVGFGISGKVFHAPLIAADPGYSLDVIVTADPGRAAEAARLYPHTRIVPTPEALFALAGDLDLVVLGTPPLTHFDLAATAIAHGLHVVVDKPFVTTAAEGAGAHLPGVRRRRAAHGLSEPAVGRRLPDAPKACSGKERWGRSAASSRALSGGGRTASETGGTPPQCPRAAASSTTSAPT